MFKTTNSVFTLMFQAFMNEDGHSLIDHGASLSSHTTSDDQVRPQLMIKVNFNFNLT